jgi:hypothetical protein
MGFDVGVVGRHHRYDVLVQPRCGLGAEISRHAVALVRFTGPRIDGVVYGVKLIRQYPYNIFLRLMNWGSVYFHKEYVTLKTHRYEGALTTSRRMEDQVGITPFAYRYAEIY